MLGEMRTAYRILVGKPERESSLRRLRHRWKDNIKIDLMEIKLEGVHCINLDQDRDWP
jgi:hypothetical protein